MYSVAVIGADGAGKTTMTRMLQEENKLPFKYLYMGINIESSNMALPTSRLLALARRRRPQKQSQSELLDPTLRYQKYDRRKPIVELKAGVRLIHRLLEEWYRQILSWTYQLQGYIVLYDRHFIFDFGFNSINKALPFGEQLHRWCLKHLYPRPKLVIYLDAPSEVLYARKREWSVKYLESRRQIFMQQGKQMSNFVQIDATQPFDQVYQEVLMHIMHQYK